MTISKYRYYGVSTRYSQEFRRSTHGAEQMGRERFNPKWSNPDFLILRERKRRISQWLAEIQGQRLVVLDIGGRIQPYRSLLEGRLERYVAIDPQLEGLVDVVAVGENLPFPDETFDLVICTQVLGYVSDPPAVVSEIFRVLKHGASLVFTVPEFSIRHHDERWRFLPDGLRLLFSRFSQVEVVPEGCSVYGFFRTINTCLYFFPAKERVRQLFSVTAIPMLNLAGFIIDKIHSGNEKLVANNCVFARK